MRSQLTDNIWAGRRCFVIGGGPSLSGFDWSQLDGELTIGTNRVFEFYMPSIISTVDRRYLVWIMEGKYGEEAKRKILGTSTPIVLTKPKNSQEPPFDDIMELDALGFDGLPGALKDGLYTGRNSGYAAINLAVALGCKEIYLLGFDMHGEDGKQAHFHDGHPITKADDVYADKFLPHFDKLAPLLKERGIRVVNCAPDSALVCFEHMDFADIKPLRRPLVVSYYTKGTGYEAEAQKMQASAHLFGFECDLRGIETRGGWKANTYYKAEFLRAMLDEHPDRNLLWLDADVEVKQYPALLDVVVADIAVCIMDWSKYEAHSSNDPELNTSVIFLRNNERVRCIMDAWIAENAKQYDVMKWEQRNLQNVLYDWKGPDTPILNLPDTYCQIFDFMASAGDPVIELHQASRYLKQEVGA